MKQIFKYTLIIAVFSCCNNLKTNNQTIYKDSLKIDSKIFPKNESDIENFIFKEAGYLQIVDNADNIEFIKYSNLLDSVLSYNKININDFILQNNPSYGEKKGKTFMLDENQYNLYYFLFRDFVDDNSELKFEWVKLFKCDLLNFHTVELIKIDSLFPIVWCFFEKNNSILFIDENHNLKKVNLESVSIKLIDSLYPNLSNMKIWIENDCIKVSGHLEEKVIVISYDSIGMTKTEKILGKTQLSISHINNTAINGNKFVELGNDSYFKGGGNKMIVNYNDKIDTIRIDFEGSCPYWIDSNRILLSRGNVQYVYNYKTRNIGTIYTENIYVYQEIENELLFIANNDTIYYLMNLENLKIDRINLKHRNYFDLYKIKPAPNTQYSQ